MGNSKINISPPIKELMDAIQDTPDWLYELAQVIYDLTDASPVLASSHARILNSNELFPTEDLYDYLKGYIGLASFDFSKLTKTQFDILKNIIFAINENLKSINFSD